MTPGAILRAELILAAPGFLGGENRSNHRTAGAKTKVLCSVCESPPLGFSERKIPNRAPRSRPAELIRKGTKVEAGKRSGRRERKRTEV